MLVTSSCANVAPYGTRDRKTTNPRQAALLPSPDDETDHGVEVYPTDVVKRHAVAWDGMTAEIVQATRCEKLEFRFRGPLHLLAVCDQGMRSDGDTFVEGLPRSKLRDVRRKLTFVPAGRAYHEWHEPRVLTRVVFFYFDPAKMPAHAEASGRTAPLASRLFFEDAALLDTALKLKRLIENTGPESSPYFGLSWRMSLFASMLGRHASNLQ